MNRPLAVLLAFCLSVPALSADALGIEVDLTISNIEVHEYRDSSCSAEDAMRDHPMCFRVTVQRLSGASSPTNIVLRVTYDIHPPQRTESFAVTFRGEENGATEFLLLPVGTPWGFGAASIEASVSLASSADIDTNPENNAYSGLYIVRDKPPPPPPPTKYADFYISSLRVGPSPEVRPSALMEIAFEVENVGSEDAVAIPFTIYASKDKALSADDRVVSTIVIPEIHDGWSHTGTVTDVPADSEPGAQYFLGVADPDNQIEEEREDNNLRFASYLVSNAQGVLQFRSAIINVPEHSSNDHYIYVDRVGGGIGEISVDLMVDPASTANFTRELTSNMPARMHFRDGFRDSQQFWIHMKNDSEYEGTESVIFKLVNPVPDGTLNEYNEMRVDISDNQDNPGVMTFGSDEFEVDEFMPHFVLRVYRTVGRNGIGTLRCRTLAGSAKPGVDYVHTDVRMSFFWGNPYREIPIRLFYNPESQGSRSFTVELYNLDGLFPGEHTSAIVTISESNFTIDQENGGMDQTFALDAGVAQEFSPSLPLLDVAEILVSADSSNTASVPIEIWAEVRADSLTGPVLTTSDPSPVSAAGREVVRFRFPRQELVQDARYVLVLHGTAPGIVIHGGGNLYARGRALIDLAARPDVDLWFRQGQFARVTVESTSISDVKSRFRSR